MGKTKRNLRFSNPRDLWIKNILADRVLATGFFRMYFGRKFSAEFDWNALMSKKPVENGKTALEMLADAHLEGIRDFEDNVLRRGLVHVLTKQKADEMVMNVADSYRFEGRAIGKVEGMTHAVAVILKARFGKIPATLEKRLSSLDDLDQITELIELAATCESLSEFKKSLR